MSTTISHDIDLATIETIINDPASTSDQLLSAGDQLDALIKILEDGLAEERSKMLATSDQTRRGVFGIRIRKAETTIREVRRLNDLLRQRLDRVIALDNAEQRGRRCQNREATRMKVLDELSKLPSKIGTAAVTARAKTLREHCSKIHRQIIDLKGSSDHAAFDELLRAADEGLHTTVHSAGPHEASLMTAFIAAVRSYVPAASPDTITTA